MIFNNNTADCNRSQRSSFVFQCEENQCWKDETISATTPNLLNENYPPIRNNNYRQRKNHQRTHSFYSPMAPPPTAIIRNPTPIPIRPVQQPRRNQRPPCIKQRARPVHVGRAFRGANHVWLTQH